MKYPDFRNLSANLGLSSLLACVPIAAQTIDFESPAYLAEKTIVGIDGWAMAGSATTDLQDNFTIQSGPENKWLHCLTNGATFVHRNFPDRPGIIDLRWRWRAMNDSASICLGASGNTGGSGIATRAQICIDPFGHFHGLGLQSITSTERWTVQTWYYMRMRMDVASNQYTLYVSTDSLRLGEHIAIPISDMNGVGTLTRLFLRDQNGAGAADVDDITWGNLSFWRGEVDTTWSDGKNWSTGTVPDSLTHVLFDEISPKNCFVDRNAQVNSISMPLAWTGTFNLDASTLTVFGNADFTSATFDFLPSATIHFSSPKAQSLQPATEGTFPHFVHDGGGTLRLDTRPMFASNFTQLDGSLNFNGQDIYMTGKFLIKNGKPGTLQNLDGRSITVGKSAHLEGTSQDTLLDLVSTPRTGQPLKGWSITVTATDTLSARFATIGNSRANGAPGYALLSGDAGNNTGWVFGIPPSILIPPRDTTVKVGQNATFKVSVSSKLATLYQWLRNDQMILGARDSVYTLVGAKRSDSGTGISCRVTSLGGSATSASAKLNVIFPAPTILPAPKTFTDSISVKLSTTVTGAKIFYSRNGLPFLEYSSDIVLKDSTRLKAFAMLGTDSSGLTNWNYPKLLLPLAQTPVISPDPSTPFQDSQVVTITGPTSGSSIFYTLDQSDPDSSKSRYTTPLTLRATTTVSARAYKSGYRPSIIRTNIYMHKTVDTAITLGKPQAIPPGGTFPDTMVVSMFPPASTPDAVLYYTFGTAGLLKYATPITLRASGTLKIIAIKGSVFSDTMSYTFTRQLEAPMANPKGKIFHDSLLINLTSNTPGATIHYTWNGKDPISTSPIYPGVPILLDSSANLKAIAIKDSNVSAVMSETYTLIADTVKASYGSGDYTSRIQIQLQTSTKRALIYYSLDGSTPGPESGSQPYTSPFWIETTATLKAVAVTGQGSRIQRSPMLTVNYSFITPGLRVLGPGQKIDLSSNYSLNSILPGASSVNVEVLRTDSLTSLKGFRDIQFAIRLSLPLGSTAFPSIGFTAPTGEPRALYSLVGTSTVNYITDADAYTIGNPGTYFLALDTLAPQIILSGESFGTEDSTKALFTIQDNVSNLLLDVSRSDNPARNLVAKSITSPNIMSVSLRNPAGSILPLTIKLMVDDHHLKTTYPAEPGSSHLLAQKNSAPVRTPAVFNLGSQVDNPWDLIALPLSLDPPLTMAQIRKNNAAPGLEAATWDIPTGKYRYLKDMEVLAPGTSIWMASTSSMASLVFPTLQTLPYQEKGVFKLVLHKGWNQVANPTLSTLYWPVTRTLMGIYDQSPLKGLNGYNATTQLYVHSDSLLPWRGYFAFYLGGRDTTINLSFSPIQPEANNSIAAKPAAVAGFAFSLGLANVPALRLGAISQAQDGIGIEDEMRPPAQGEQSSWLWAARDKSQLETDLRHWIPGALYSWRVVARTPTESHLVGNQNPVLPDGYAAWAVSRTRGLRFRIQAGLDIPMYPGLVDSFEVWAGPAAELEARLAGVPLSVQAFQLQISTTAGGFDIHLQLPEAALVRWTLWGLDGRAYKTSRMSLPEGIYHLAPAAIKSRLTTGMYVLSMDWTSRAGSIRSGANGHISRKIIIP